MKNHQYPKKKSIDKDFLSLEDDDFDHFPGKESSPINILETTRPSKLSKKRKNQFYFAN